MDFLGALGKDYFNEVIGVGWRGKNGRKEIGVSFTNSELPGSYGKQRN